MQVFRGSERTDPNGLNPGDEITVKIRVGKKASGSVGAHIIQALEDHFQSAMKLLDQNSSGAIFTFFILDNHFSSVSGLNNMLVFPTGTNTMMQHETPGTSLVSALKA
jgi:hypothetical protein